jgi:hypothetical protein
LKYTSDYFHSDPGKVLRYREFPFSYSKAERAIFVEQGERLFYLKATSERVVV